jgi:hypothetical protein
MVWDCNPNVGLLMVPADMIPLGNEVCSHGQCCGTYEWEQFFCCDPTTERCCAQHRCPDPRCVNDGEGGYAPQEVTPEPDGGT